MIKSLTALGSGAAFTMTNRQSNMLLKDENGKGLLIDAGTDIRHSLALCHETHRGVNGVYASHLHADHIGGLEWLALYTYFDPGYKGRPELFVHKSLVHELWNCVKGGLSTLQGKTATLKTFFDVKPVQKNKGFTWEGNEFTLVQTVHIVSEFSFNASYGLLFEVNGLKVFYTGDTQFAPNQLVDFYQWADLIFQDCETSAFKSRVHAHYDELRTLPDEQRAKMWLYHYSDGTLPDAKADGFRGFVSQGQVFTFDDPSSLNG